MTVTKTSPSVYVMTCNSTDGEKVSCKNSVASTTRRRVELLALSEGWSVGVGKHVCKACLLKPKKKADAETDELFKGF